MDEYGFVKVGAAVLELKIADVIYNVEKIKDQVNLAIKKNIQILVFPELSLTGYTCGDLFHQDILINSAYKGLQELKNFSSHKKIVFIVGCPIKSQNKLFNTAVVINNGKILGIVPKTYLPNYNEFYEMRHFNSSNDLKETEINLFGETVKIGTDLIFSSNNNPNLKFAIEICEDVWSVKPRSNDYALNGATIIFNLSASNETIGKYNYRQNLIQNQSSTTISGYVYTSSGICESSSDILFSGCSMIYENGTLLSENERFNFQSNLIYNDIDVNRLANDRAKNTSFKNDTKNIYRITNFDIYDNPILTREYSKTPFVPTNIAKRNERCEEIFNILSSALANRLRVTNIKKCVIGISGGLDSTLAFLIIKKTYEKLGLNPKDIIAITMPGFGTTKRTYNNAKNLVTNIGATLLEIDIKKACIGHYQDINQDLNNHDVVYENVQARERTQILMDVANKENALVIGTGDLSELALGWCTYNGDHMSMYAINSSIPKTLVKYLVEYIADKEEPIKPILKDIIETPISPELLPPTKNDNINQITEDNIGPYILHDFYLYHFLRYGASPKKIYLLATKTFQDTFSNAEILKWLKVFIKRFFTQQFKRNCLPDTVKVGSISLSPRGDLRMPSDASYHIWLNELEEIENERRK